MDLIQLAHRRRDRGSASIENLIAIPLLLLMVVLVVQAGMWVHAHHVAAAAAQTAVAVARVEQGTAGEGGAAGADALGQNAGGSLEGASLTVDRGGESVTVTVTGQAAAILPFPGLTWPVTATATGPVEQFHPPGAGE